jgi:hypothetical protein
MDRFFGFSTPQTWIVYDAFTRYGRREAYTLLKEAEELSNPGAADHARKRIIDFLHDTTKHADGKTPSVFLTIVRSSIDDTCNNVCYGELLVALRWNLYGQNSKKEK